MVGAGRAVPAAADRAAAVRAPARSTIALVPASRLLGIFLPIIGNWSGWIFTEMGRQPWVVFGLLKTSDARSPDVSMGSIIISLAGYVAALRLPASRSARGCSCARSRTGPTRTAARPAATIRPDAGPDLVARLLSMRDPNFLQTLWFVLIGVLWVGYFILEGFDFGVGMLLRVIGRDTAEKRAVIHTIGPVWDGNEVWLLTAGGATFAAFPGWYASLFSGFYLALFLILCALIIRGVSFEFWGKDDSPALARDLGVDGDDRQLPGARCCGASAGPTSSTAWR